MSSSNRFGAPAIALHWLIAVLIFSGFALGLFMHELPASPAKLLYYSWHKWIGVTVFLLAIARGLWRATHAAPAPPAGPAWQHRAAQGMHAALYVLMFAIPLSGWLHSSAAGYQTVYFGVLPLPDLIGKNEALAHDLGEVHEILNFVLLFLLVGHAGVALLHQFVQRDHTLERMLPEGKRWPGLATLGTLIAFSFVALMFFTEDEGQESPVAATTTAVAPADTVGELSAEFRQMGVGVSGQFKRFHFEALNFDDSHPQVSAATIVVDTASFDIGDEEYNGEVRKPEWFDSAQFPEARFVSDQVRELDDHRFEATGSLTIKGKTQPATVTFSADKHDHQWTFTGQTTLSRAAYGIGDPSWNDVLEDAVTVTFNVSVPER